MMARGPTLFPIFLVSFDLCRGFSVTGPAPPRHYKLSSSNSGRAEASIGRHAGALISPYVLKGGTLDGDEDGGGVDTDLDRRRALFTLASSLTSVVSSPAPAIAAQTAAEAVRRTAANIPGYGPPDVFFPSVFKGKWIAVREIVNSDEPALKGVALPLTVSYEVRFVSVDGDDKDLSAASDKIIADRGFNEASLYRAVRSAMERAETLEGAPPLPPPFRASSWVASNPNVLSLSFADGTSREIKVTKRSSDIGKDQSTVFSSEFRRITDVGSSGIPSVTGSRALTKWKIATRGGGNSDSIVIEGIEIVYNEQVIADPLGSGEPDNTGVYKSSKSRIRLERILG